MPGSSAVRCPVAELPSLSSTENSVRALGGTKLNGVMLHVMAAVPSLATVNTASLAPPSSVDGKLNVHGSIRSTGRSPPSLSRKIVATEPTPASLEIVSRASNGSFERGCQITSNSCWPPGVMTRGNDTPPFGRSTVTLSSLAVMLPTVRFVLPGFVIVNDSRCSA